MSHTLTMENTVKVLISFQKFVMKLYAQNSNNGGRKMLRKMKKILVLPMLMFTMIFTPMVTHAQEMTQPNIGVSETSPEERGTNRPKKVWDISSKGKYEFGGSSNNITIYSNYSFKGKTSYSVYVKNTGNHSITVKAKTFLKTYAKKKISAGKTATFKVTDIKKDTEFYLVFEGSEFSGHIK